MVDIYSFFGDDDENGSDKDSNKANQQRFELNALPPPPLIDDDEPIVINVTVQTNSDNDFVNFQLGEFCTSIAWNFGFFPRTCFPPVFHQCKSVNTASINMIHEKV